MKIAFIDESGSPSPNDHRRFFAVGAIVVDSSRPFELIVKHIRRSLKRRIRTSELKAATSHPKVIQQMLTALSQENVEVFGIVVDKTGLQKEQAEMVYQNAIGYTLEQCARHHPILHVFLDKRYTHHPQQVLLEQTIRQHLTEIPNQMILIEQADSASTPGLQAVDFVAWAFNQKYEFNQAWATDIISPQILIEEVIKATKIAALPGGR